MIASFGCSNVFTHKKNIAVLTEEARNWDNLTTRAESGDAEALCEIAEAYRFGEGVAKDYGKAMLWLQKGAAEGKACAIFQLGAMYCYGEGVPADANKAL